MPSGKQLPAATNEVQAAVESLANLSELLWRESTFKRLVGRFATLQCQKFGMLRCNLLRLSSNGPKLSWEKSPLQGDWSDLGDETVASLGRLLLKHSLHTTEYRYGLHNVSCNDDNLFFALLGNPLADWYILVWQATYDESTFLYADFLTKQLQQAVNWLAQLDQTQEMLLRDELTGLYNVRYLDEALDKELLRAERFDLNFCLLFIDVDHFKSINDKFGHVAGSSILCQVARLLGEASREIDSLIRFGGDEFIILLLGASGSAGVLVAERIRRAVEDARFVLDDGVHVSLTISVGVAAYPEHAQSKKELLELADETMYYSKRRGKNRVTMLDSHVSKKELLSKVKDIGES